MEVIRECVSIVNVEYRYYCFFERGERNFFLLFLRFRDI